MTGASRSLALITFAAAGVLALSACGTTGPQPAVTVTTTVPDSPQDSDGDPAQSDSGSGSDSDSTSDPATTTGAAAQPAAVRCTDAPKRDARTEVVVNRGEMDCGEVTALLDEFSDLARSGRFGNAGIVPDLDGFSCASPTFMSARLAGYGTKCSKSDVEILVRPVEPRIPGIQQDVGRFIPDSAQMQGRSFFTLPGGKAFCAIYPDHNPANAECYGPLPAGLPTVVGLGDQLAKPTAVRVTETGPATLAAPGTAPYPMDGVPFPTLEEGQTLASAGFACTVTAADAVTCTNTGGDGFSYSPEEVSVD